MKLRLTPLNIVTALGVALLGSLLFQPNTDPSGHGVNTGVVYKLLCGALIVVTLISDLIFRFTIKNLKRIWIIEMAFIIIAVIMFLILQK
jgi:glucan phosphoethanolaminetransferase (alkaline phosphatase superfamily)